MSVKKIKFPTRDSDFISELRGRVNEYFEQNKLSKYGNASLVVKSVFMMTLFLLPYALMLAGLIQSIPFFLAAWAVMGAGIAGVGMGMMHDANHGSYSRNPKLNQWLGRSLYLLGGYPANWRFQHNTLHHGFTNIDGHDEDIDPGNILRLSPHKPRFRFHRYQHIYAWFLYGLMTISWVIDKDFKSLSRYREMNASFLSRRKYRNFWVDLILSKMVYWGLFIALPIVLMPVAWYWIITGFVLMHMVAGLILGVVFQTAHVVPTSEYPLPDDQGNVENNWAIHQLLTTSDFAPRSKLLFWLTGGLNFQVVHHLFPNISHVHYQKLSPIVTEVTQKYNLPYHIQPIFFQAVRGHKNMLKTLGRTNPDR